MDYNISPELPPVQLPDKRNQQLHAFDVQSGTERTERQLAQATERPLRAVVAPPPAARSQQIQSATPIATQPVQSATTATIPLVADDNDLIEKEWVLRAKAIVAQTATDPYRQNKEIEHIKADYMQKRYNKQIKITEN